MSMAVNIEVDEETLRALVIKHLQTVCEGLAIDNNDITIEVKSKNNFKSEWETAAYRARVQKRVKA